MAGRSLGALDRTAERLRKRTRRMRASDERALSHIQREDAVAILLCLAYLVILYNYVNLQIPAAVPFSPDESSALFTSKMLTEKGTIFWTSLLNEKYGVKFFRPRLFTEVAPNTYVTAGSIGFAILLAFAAELQILPFLVSIIAAAGVLAAYSAIAQVYDKRAGLFVAAAVGALPTFVFFSNAYFDIVPSVGFFLMSLVLFLTYLKTSKTWQIILSSVFLSISVLVRPYSVVFMVGYFAAIPILRRRLCFKSLVIGGACFLIVLAPVLIVNDYAYGHPFMIGLTSTAGIVEIATTERLQIEAYLIAFINHVLGLTPLLFLLGIFGGAIVLKENRTQSQSVLLAHLVSVSAVSFVVFGSLSRTYGFYEVTPIASVSRYLMPIYLLLSCFAYAFVRRLIDLRMKRISLLVVSLLLVSLLAGSLTSNALPSLVTTRQNYDAAREVIRALPQESVVFTRTLDKLVFPGRNVALVYTNADVAQNPYLRYMVPVVNIDRDVIPVIQKLLLDGVHVFLAEDVDDLADHLVRSGYVVRRVGTTFLREVSFS